MPKLQKATITIVSTKAGLRADFVGRGFLYASQKALLKSFAAGDEACVVGRIPVDEQARDDNSTLFKALNAFTSAVSADAITDTLEGIVLRVYEAGVRAKK